MASRYHRHSSECWLSEHCALRGEGEVREEGRRLSILSALSMVREAREHREWRDTSFIPFNSHTGKRELCEGGRRGFRSSWVGKVTSEYGNESPPFLSFPSRRVRESNKVRVAGNSLQTCGRNARFTLWDLIRMSHPNDFSDCKREKRILRNGCLLLISPPDFRPWKPESPPFSSYPCISKISRFSSDFKDYFTYFLRAAAVWAEEEASMSWKIIL